VEKESQFVKIAVASGKGETGKTTVAVNMAHLLNCLIKLLVLGHCTGDSFASVSVCGSKITPLVTGAKMCF